MKGEAETKGEVETKGEAETKGEVESDEGQGKVSAHTSARSEFPCLL